MINEFEYFILFQHSNFAKNDACAYGVYMQKFHHGWVGLVGLGWAGWVGLVGLGWLGWVGLVKTMF